MPSEFAQQFAETSWPMILEQFGETVLYRPKGAAVGAPPIAIVAVIDRGVVEAEYNDADWGQFLVATAKVSTGDVADPQRGDTVIFDSQEWPVSSFDPSDGSGYVLLHLKRHEPETVSGGVDPVVRG
jgi:hypothetical protein